MADKNSRPKRRWLRWLTAAVAAALILPGAVLGMNARVKRIAAPHVLAEPEGQYDCILVLGCGVWNGDTPSYMLADRLDTAIDLYRSGAADRLLMSGDHGTEGYDEVNVMKRYAVEAGVPPEKVFMDHAGFSTYESLYRARDVFACRRVLVVTQTYHLYRALYIAERLGLEADGISADVRRYAGESYRETREILARCKDFFQCVLQPEPTYLGEVIPITGDGGATDDKPQDWYTA